MFVLYYCTYCMQFIHTLNYILYSYYILQRDFYLVAKCFLNYNLVTILLPININLSASMHLSVCFCVCCGVGPVQYDLTAADRQV